MMRMMRKHTFYRGVVLGVVVAGVWSVSACRDHGSSEAVPGGGGPTIPSGGEAVKSPEEGGDLRALLEAALATEEKEIVLPPGRYRVSPVDRAHLVLRGVRDRVIIADGVEMICTETTRALTIENCHNVTLRGLTIDYDPLPFTQAHILEISPDKSTLRVAVLPGYPPLTPVTGSVEIFDPATNHLRGRLTYFNTRCEPGADGLTARLTKSNVRPELAAEQLGDIVVIKTPNAPGGEIPHAIMATDCSGLVMENVTLFASPMFGFLENGCDESKYIGCVVGRRSPESEGIVRGHPRLRSLNADAFHSKNARRGPAYERCTAQFMGDDAIAINGDFHFVALGEGRVWRVLAKTRMTMRAGEDAQIFTYDGRRLEDRRIVSVTPDGEVTGDERALIERQAMNEHLRRNGLSTAWRVELDQEVSVPPGTLICSANRIGNGFSIRNCQVGFNRSRGILVKAGHGVIADNLIEGSVMTGILISPEYWWLEAGLSDELVISGNRIEGGRGMGIAVVAEGGNHVLAQAGTFRNIRVTGNTIKGGASPGLLLTSIRGLSEEGNVVRPDPGMELFPWQIGPWGREGVQPVMRVNVE